MPIFEFYCPENHTVYQFLARSHELREAVPVCPDNPAYTMHKQVSRFAIVGKAREETDGDPFANLDDSQMEALLAGMEGDMGALDAENPDPRQLGRLMNKMTEVMGDKVPVELKEIAKRLQAGEDPGKLEAEFSGLDGGDDLFTQVKKWVGRNQGPVRNPKLYDMGDWLRP
ncbi:MAG TPA: cytochrome C [Prosthecobacter sp.]